MKITIPCWLPDLDEDVYHGDPCPDPSLSSSIAKALLEPGGPARVREVHMNGRPAKKAWEFGHAAHERILGRGRPLIAVGGNRNANKVKEEIATWEAEGHQVVKPAELAAVDAMAEQILKQPLAGDLFTQGAGQPEVSMFGVDNQTGRWMRGRLDFLLDRDLIVDYKTVAGAADVASWEKQSWKYGYHVQAAHYLGLARQLDLVNPGARFLFVAQEKTAPYLCGVYELDQDLLVEGADRVRSALNIWDRCLELNEWPGLPAGIQTITKPAWATTYEED